MSSIDERSAKVKEHERRAAVILDGMYQFVALLNTKGDILEVNRAALEGAGHEIHEIRGKPFWTARWWQVSEQIQQDLKVAIRRAAAGEFVRYEVDIYGEQSGLAPITIDFSLQPIRGESGKVEYLLPEGRNITERKLAEEQISRQAQELRVLNERLKELDRLKTQFFTNVSHEFRTPLTLMLGPLEDALANAHGILPGGAAKDLDVSHRNALQLLKLVNTMLDFSSIEAGRIEARYEPVDLATLTAQLASNFRSACEKAGLRLVVDCPPLGRGESVYVDRDMWDKIVLNLVSNAFKFTLEGEIEVRLQAIDGQACLTVRDTGVGIPPAELPHMFERFHRSEHSRGRTHEGTGIGLALVQELVKLHGGTVRVESRLGEGSTFTVTIPFGKAHLDPQRIGTASDLASTAIASSAFVEEAVRWLPETATHKREAEHTWAPALATSDRNVPEVQPQDQRARILLADDNSDMRQYVSRLLGEHFDVQAVADGQTALEAARAEPPDLVLSDIMMPRLDGFGLLLELRADPQLRQIPIILLSARAGEESRIEGVEAGADDYLIKPFSARELLARVGAQLAIACVRREAAKKIQSSEAELRDFVENANVGLHRVGSDGIILWANQTELDLLGYTCEEYIGHSIAQFHLDASVSEDILTRLRRGERVLDCETRMRCKDGSIRHVLINSGGFFEGGKFIHSRCVTQDITERKQGQGATALLSAIVDSSDDAIISKDLNGIITSWNKGAERLFGYMASEAVGRSITMLIPPDRLDEEPTILERLKHGARVDHFETIRMRKDGSRLDISLTISPVKDADGHIVGASKVARDITERTRIERQHHEFSRELEKLVSQRTGELEQAHRALIKDLEERQTLEDQFRQAQKMESMGTLAAGVAHDLNNILNIIQGYTSVLGHGSKPDEIDESVEAITETTQRGVALVQQLLTLARKTETKLEPTDANALIQGLSKLLKETFPKNIELSLNLARLLPSIMADPNQITQVLLNLCVNARDAMPDGGTLTLKSRLVHGTELEEDGDLKAEEYVSIDVTDTGTGMDENVQSKMFEPFFTTKEIGQGTGLGLAVVYGIVKSHNGFIQVKSQPLHGTTITLYFPVLSSGHSD